MKKLLLLFTLLAAGMAYSQDITEKDLLGEWRLITLAAEGGLIDVEAGTVTFPEGELEKLAEKGRTREEETKEILAAFDGMKVVFSPGNKILMTTSFDENDTGYSITNKDGKTILSFSHTTVQLTLKGDILEFVYEDTARPTIVTFKKLAK